MSDDFRVYTRGIPETVRSLNKIQRRLGRVVTDELKEVAGPIASKAQEFAVARGLVGPTGNLSRKIKPFATGKAIGIRETATRKAGSGKRGGRFRGRFSYPSMYEYGPRGTGESVGPRAFMYPAAQWGAPEVERRLAEALDRLTASA